MTEALAPRRRGRILSSLLLLLFAVGVVPLVWTSYSLVAGSRESLEFDQKDIQLDKARLLSQQVAIYVQSLRSQVAAIARTLEVDRAPPSSARLQRIRDSTRRSSVTWDRRSTPFSTSRVRRRRRDRAPRRASSSRTSAMLQGS